MWTKRDRMLCRADGLTVRRRRADTGRHFVEVGFNAASGQRLHEADVLNVLRALRPSPLSRVQTPVEPGTEAGWLAFPTWNGLASTASFVGGVIALRETP